MLFDLSNRLLPPSLPSGDLLWTSAHALLNSWSNCHRDDGHGLGMPGVPRGKGGRATLCGPMVPSRSWLFKSSIFSAAETSTSTSGCSCSSLSALRDHDGCQGAMGGAGLHSGMLQSGAHIELAGG